MTPAELRFDAETAAARWPQCPSDVLKSLQLYVEFRLGPGHFLRAVLENDLFTAVNRADDERARVLRSIVGVVFNHVPPEACGSKDAVQAWLARRSS